MAPAPKNISVPGPFCSCSPATGRALSGRPQCQRIDKCPSSARPCHEWQAEVPVERKCRMPDAGCRMPDSAIQRFSDSAMSRCPDVPMSRCPDVPTPRCPNAPMSQRPDVFTPRVFSQGRVSTHCPCGVRFSDHPVLQHADINHVVARINETSKRYC